MNRDFSTYPDRIRERRAGAVVLVLVISLLALILALVPLAAANSDSTGAFSGAGTITVTTTDDELNTDGDCSLREAIQAANTDSAVDACPTGSGEDTVIVPAGTYTLTIPGVNEDANATGDLDILDDLSIEGAGAVSSIIDGGAIDRILQVRAVTVHILDITIRNGFSSLYGGGGISNLNGTAFISNSIIVSNISRFGGGISNSALDGGTARMTVNNAVIQDNTATNSHGGYGWGGGIINGAAYANSAAILTVTNSLVADNQAIGTGDRKDGIGGGIANTVYECSTCGAKTVILDSTIRNNEADIAGGIASSPWETTGTPVAQLIVERSTVSDNVARGRGHDKGSAGGIIAGGGLIKFLDSTISENFASGSSTGVSGWGGGILFISTYDIQAVVSISNTTIASNTAEINGGGIAIGRAIGLTPTVSVANSIVANNRAPSDASCHDPLIGITSQGYNLEDSDLCGFDQSTDLVNTDPLLRLLADNGGPTETHALSAASPALDQGSCAGSLTDQRGFIRPVDIAAVPNADDSCDIGSYELNPIYVFLPVLFSE